MKKTYEVLKTMADYKIEIIRPITHLHPSRTEFSAYEINIFHENDKYLFFPIRVLNHCLGDVHEM